MELDIDQVRELLFSMDLPYMLKPSKKEIELLFNVVLPKSKLEKLTNKIVELTPDGSSMDIEVTSYRAGMRVIFKDISERWFTALPSKEKSEALNYLLARVYAREGVLKLKSIEVVDQGLKVNSLIPGVELSKILSDKKYVYLVETNWDAEEGKESHIKWIIPTLYEK